MARPFADPEELRIHLGKAEIDVERAVQLLMQASDLIRAYCRRPLSPVTEEITVNGNGRQVLMLPNYPVTAVAVSIDEQELVLDTDYFLEASSGLLTKAYGDSWTCGIHNVGISYTHGLDPIPEDIKHECLALAGNAMAFREQVSPDTFGEGVVEARGFPPQMTLTAATRAAVAPYRSAHVA